MNDTELTTDAGLLQFERLYAKLYYFLSHKYLHDFKYRDGEEALRKVIRKYAEYRGTKRRGEHKDRGLPISVYTLFTYGGFPGKAGFKRNQTTLAATERISETLKCPLFDEWQALGGVPEGLCYCEEIHKTMWAAYDSRIHTVQPKIMTRGDASCTFEVHWRAEDDSHVPSIPPREELPDVAMTAEEAIVQIGDLWAAMYYFLAEGLLDAYGLEGERALRQAIREYGNNRGIETRDNHLKRGYPINLFSLFSYYDLPDDRRFERNKIELTPETRISQTLRCPYAEVWEQLGGGKNRIAQIYCEEVHHALFGAYAPAVQVNLCHPLTHEGSDYCMFSVYLRTANNNAG
jgi:hypothetical protein